MRQIPFGRPVIGEEERNAVAQVLAGNTLVHGPLAKDFESRFGAFCGASHTVSLSSCTAALHLAYFYLGLGEGDEVIVPAQTHTATAHAVELVRAKPVFVDTERETGNIDIDQLEGSITSRTKAISVVHYLGMPVDMTRVMAIAKRHGIFVVEDCALAIGSYLDGQHAGNFGDVGCFSFYPVKHITTAEGGALITKHAEVAKMISTQKAFGYDRTITERSIPGIYDVKYLGFNYRMNELEAAIGIEQIKRIPGFLKQRRENYETLSRGLREIPEIQLLSSTNGRFISSYYCLSAILSPQLTPKRFELVRYLNDRGIGTSIYYPRPVPHFTYYRDKYGYGDESFPAARWISDSSIALPVGPHLTPEDMHYVVLSMKEGISALR